MKRSKKPIKRARKRKPTMARRRFGQRVRTVVVRSKSRYHRAGGIRGIGSQLQPFATGIGMARIAEQIVGRVAPQFQPYAALAGGYLGGRAKGLIGEVVYEAMTGRGGVLSMLNIGGASQQVTTEAL